MDNQFSNRKFVNKLRLLLLFISIFVCIGMPFANVRYEWKSRFDSYVQKDGLSSTIIQSICQDKDGFMWFGTSGGIHRFDGQKFKYYKSGSADGQIHAELIRCIFRDSKERLWIGAEDGGLYQYNVIDDNFRYISLSSANTKYSANTVAETKDGYIYVGTDEGLAILTGDTILKYVHINQEGFAGLRYIRSLLCDQLGNIWIGTEESGLFLFSPQEETVIDIELPGTKKEEEVRALALSSDTTVWVGTYNNGVYTIDPRNTSPKAVHENRLPTDSNIGTGTVKAIEEGVNGDMWIGTRAGLIRFDRQTGLCTISTADPHNNDAIIQNSVIDLYTDNMRNLWIGTRGGISYRDRFKQAFLQLQESKNDNNYLNNNQVYNFLEVSDDELWIGTESGGINIFNKKTQRLSYITKDNSSLPCNCIKSMVKCEDNVLVGTFMGGMCVVDAKTKKVKNIYKYSPYEPFSLRNNNVWNIVPLRDNKFLMCTSAGLDEFDMTNGTFRHIDNIAYDKEVKYAMIDPDGDIWCLSDEVIIYQRKQDHTIRYDEKARQVVEGKDGVFYLATAEHGLAVYNKFSGVIKYIGEDEGLCNDNTQAMVLTDSCLWVTTVDGLSRVSLSDGAIKNFGDEDGLQIGHFNYGAALLLSDGMIAVGGNDGANLFYPANIETNTFIPPVVITNIRIMGENAGMSEVLVDKETGQQSVQLSYDRNMVSFRFAALSFSKSAKNSFKYRLIGMYDEWIETDNKGICTFTNLHPGEYTLEVIGSNSDGVWSKTPVCVGIWVEAPFWMTWWFRILTVFVVSCICTVVLWQYRKRTMLKADLEFERRKSEEIEKLEKIKMDFFTNVSHELRTPLTLILGPLSNILKNGNVDDITRDQALIAEHNANNLLGMVNQILDFRKIESGTISLSLSDMDLNVFVGTISRSFASMAEKKNISLSYTCTSEDMMQSVKADSDKLEKILNNLISNAIKYTPDGGKVDVSLSYCPQFEYRTGAVSDTYQIRVRDNGRGISEDEKEHLFERFYQTHAEDSAVGSGIGLCLVNDFVHLMQGTIEIESKPGIGSEFIVSIPFVSGQKVQEQKVEEDSAEVENDLSVSESNDKPILLIVDDNQEMRDFVANSFGTEFEKITAEDGVEAFKIASERVPDIVVTDLMMPNMCGDELCRKLKNDEHTCHIPVILLTAIHGRDAEINSLKCGANDYVTKPFDPDILVQKVRNMLYIRERMQRKFRIQAISEPKKVEVQSPDEKFMIRSMAVIEKYISDPDFDIEQFAREVGVSRMQLYRKINALTGMTVKEFLRSIRIKRAENLLSSGSMTVSEVSYAVGFKDIAYFRKCFKSQTGKNPSEVEKSN